MSKQTMKKFKQIPLLHALSFQWHNNILNPFQYLPFCHYSAPFDSSNWPHCRGHHVVSRSKLSSTLMMTAASSQSDEFSSHQKQHGERRRKIAVIGGGASGMFAATAASDAIQKYGASTECDVIVFEGTSKTMSKVRISGGGRCNVMHDKTKPLPQILSSYPRGSKELRGLYTKRFTPDDAYDWFTSRGVRLKTESDGRMFPTTDNSQTIIDTITNAALSAGVKIRTKEKVNSVHLIGESGCRENGKFLVNTSSKLQQSAMEEDFDAIILATGSFPHGHEIARSLGHTIVKAVPSLFTFDAKELVKDGGPFNGLAGVSVPLARMTLKVTDKMTSSPDLSSDPVKEEPSTGKNAKKKRRKKATTIIQEGPLLITHHGVSGPATLRLSAFAAREFHAMNYRSIVNIHFCPQWEEEQKQLNGGNRGNSEGILMDYLWEMTRKLPNRQISTSSPLLMKNTGNDDHASVGSAKTPNNMPIIPKRLWSALVQHSEIPPNTTWGDASKSMIRSLSNNVSSFPLTVTSKGVFKEEFVTAGGVTLKEVQMTNMESKVVPGLFFCGEVLDVDGVTGGFNFMGCWSTGFIAGEGAALACCSKVATN